MSDIATSPGALHRIRYTPMRDVLRGRLTGRLDVKKLIAQSGLPRPATELIGRIIRRTRLRPLEKADVANELIAHFADGLEAGKEMGQLLQSFGNERQAARLIARAKRRNRSLFGRIQTFVSRFVIAFVIAYLAIGIYFFSGHPAAVAPFEELNAFARQFPQSQRAWWIYKQAGEEQTRYMSANLDRIRQAATMPVVGFIVDADCAKQAAEQEEQNHWTQWPAPNFVETMQSVGSAPLSDAEASRIWGEAGRWLSDIQTCNQLCHQWRGDPSVDPNILLNFLDWEMEEIDQTIAQKPKLLRDEDLRQVAAEIAAYHNAGDLINLRYEEIRFHEMIAMRYTADGWLPSRITPAGLDDSPMWQLEWMNRAQIAFGDKPAHYLVDPALFLLMPSAATLNKRFEESEKRCRVNLSVPFRSADWSAERFSWLSARTFQYFPFLRNSHGAGNILPSVRQVAAFADYVLGHRDGVQIGIALELYHRKHQAYPAALDELDPSLFFEKPVDRITGEALHYRTVDGRPLVYSVGTDRKDDGGRLPLDDHHLPDPQSAAMRNGDGDWVIYPVPLRWLR